MTQAYPTNKDPNLDFEAPHFPNSPEQDPSADTTTSFSYDTPLNFWDGIEGSITDDDTFDPHLPDGTDMTVPNVHKFDAAAHQAHQRHFSRGTDRDVSAPNANRPLSVTSPAALLSTTQSTSYKSYAPNDSTNSSVSSPPVGRRQATDQPEAETSARSKVGLSSSTAGRTLLPATKTSSSTVQPSHLSGQQPQRFQVDRGNNSQIPWARQTPPATSGFHAQSSQVSHPGHLSALDQKIRAIANHKPLTPADNVRVSWLRKACEQGDLLYLLVHQLSCIQMRYPHFLSSDLSFLPSHIESLILLNQILADVKNVTSELLTIFCDFVTPLATFRSDRALQAWIFKAKTFLDSFVVRWESQRRRIFARGSLPSAREIVEVLSLDSPILSQAIYINYFYQLFPNASSSFMDHGLVLFNESQDRFSQVRQAGVSMDQIQNQEFQSYATQFNELARRFQQRPATNYISLHQYIHQGPTAQSQPNSQAGSVQYMTQSMNSRPRSEIFASPFQPQSSPGHPDTNAHSMTYTDQYLDELDQLHQIGPNLDQNHAMSVNFHQNRVALHQAHLSTALLAMENGPELMTNGRRFYSWTESLMGEPQIIDNDTIFETWSITIPEMIFACRVELCNTLPDNPFAKVVRMAKNGSVMLQVRCVQLLSRFQRASVGEYSCMPTVWPEHIYISLNGNHLEPQRTSSFGKDSPVDITYLVQQSSNEMQVSYHATKYEADKCFAIVAEVVRITDHGTTMGLPRSVDAETSLNAIIATLRNAARDDDLVMSDAQMSVDLIDPFTAKVSEKPVRGRDCRHRECFDLESFLQSRNCRGNDGLVQAEEWKCPICGRDARPVSLVLDHFLLLAKEQLFATGKSDVRAISVREDGSWEPKPETGGVLGATNHQGTRGLQGGRSLRTVTEVNMNQNYGQTYPPNFGEGEQHIIDLDHDDD